MWKCEYKSSLLSKFSPCEKYFINEMKQDKFICKYDKFYIMAWTIIGALAFAIHKWTKHKINALTENQSISDPATYMTFALLIGFLSGNVQAARSCVEIWNETKGVANGESWGGFMFGWGGANIFGAINEGLKDKKEGKLGKVGEGAGIAHVMFNYMNKSKQSRLEMRSQECKIITDMIRAILAIVAFDVYAAMNDSQMSVTKKFYNFVKSSYVVTQIASVLRQNLCQYIDKSRCTQPIKVVHQKKAKKEDSNSESDTDTDSNTDESDTATQEKKPSKKAKKEGASPKKPYKKAKKEDSSSESDTETETDSNTDESEIDEDEMKYFESNLDEKIEKRFEMLDNDIQERKK